MYILNGDRVYINPDNGCKSFDEQLLNCLLKLTKINSGKKIFKLNFFADTKTKEDYTAILQKIQTEVDAFFPEKILLSVIAQPPLTCKILVEACFFDPTVWKSTFFLNKNNGAALFQNAKTKVFVGNVQSFNEPDCSQNSEIVFAELVKMFKNVDMPISTIVRQWNYIENILGFDEKEQRYQTFNNVRTEFYKDLFNENGYPAATGIGMNQGGIILEFFAVQADSLLSKPINNPSQIAAHSYSKKVLEGDEINIKTTPKFERARYLELDGRKMIFISGTASIIGEKTEGAGNPSEQTEITIGNIKNLYSNEILGTLSEKLLNPKYGHARVYIKNRRDFSPIKRTFKLNFGNLPVVYIIADICRNDLLVEIEGKVILE